MSRPQQYMQDGPALEAGGFGVAFPGEVQYKPGVFGKAYLHIRNNRAYMWLTSSWWIMGIIGCLILTAVIAILITIIVQASTDGHDDDDDDHHNDFPLVPSGANPALDPWLQIDPNRIMPAVYQRADIASSKYIIVLGDEFLGPVTAGAGTNPDNWYNKLVRNTMTTSIVLDHTQVGAFARKVAVAADSGPTISPIATGTQIESLRIAFPTGFPAQAVVIVNMGWNDLLQAVDGGSGNLDGAIAQIKEALKAIMDVAPRLFPHGVFVFVADYPDASNGVGFVPTKECAAPMDVILNVPNTLPSEWVHGLEILNAVLADFADIDGFAFIPVHEIFERLGFNRAFVRSKAPPLDDAVANRHDDVYQDNCWTFNKEGHLKLSDIVGSFLTHRSVTVLF